MSQLLAIGNVKIFDEKTSIFTSQQVSSHETPNTTNQQESSHNTPNATYSSEKASVNATGSF